MKFPWQDKTGLAKAATILALLFCLSFGLCGANVLAALTLPTTTNVFFAFTAYLEATGMLVGLFGLLIVGLIAIVQSLFQLFRQGEN